MTLAWLALACLLVTAFFSAAEMSFIAANRLRLRHLAEDGHRVAAAYLDAFRNPARVLSTAMMGVTVAHIVASSATTFALIPLVGGTLAALLSTVVLTPVMLVFGEIIPKAVAREWATRLILRLYRPLVWASVLLAPFVTFSQTVVSLLLRLVGGSQPNVRHFVSREELKHLLQMEPGEANVTTQEAEMIDNIFDLGETTVREVMVPLVDVAALAETASPMDAVALIQQRGFSRLPIHAERETHVTGVVTAMDLLRHGAGGGTLGEIMRQPVFVPESKRIDDLLREMQKERVHLAVVVDEYGGATGIVTLEDIVEQIVGEIQDEHDRTPTSVDRLPDGSFWVAARTNVDELNEALDWTLPKRDYETIAGLVLSTLGRIPRTGEEFQVPGYTITVLEADSRRVVAVKIAATRPALPETAA
jgi:CBS domain containing-hemolysin-like protein